MTIENKTTLYVVSYAPANDNGGLSGFDWFYADQRDEALIHYGRMSEMSYNDSIVRLVEVPWDKDQLDNPEIITDYLDSLEGLDNIEINYMAIREHIPNTVDNIDRLPIHSRTKENINKVLANKNAAPIDMIQDAVVCDADVIQIKNALDLMMDLNDDFLDEINTEYLRGQIEFVANSMSIETESEIVKKLLCDIVENISGKDVS